MSTCLTSAPGLWSPSYVCHKSVFLCTLGIFRYALKIICCFFQRDEARKAEQEFMKNWEDSRQGRVNSWNSFITGKTASSSSSAMPPAPTMSSSVSASAAATAVAAAPAPPPPPVEKKKKKEKQRFSPMGFRPPKHKPETR